MKKILFAFAALALFAGCTNPSGSNPNNNRLEIEVKPGQQMAPPASPAPPAPPFIPPIHSPHFMYGYWDGYYMHPANWRWWASPDYRYGYDLGNYDRIYNIHRFNP